MQTQENHPYRRHFCGSLGEDHCDKMVRLAGWIHAKRDHGPLLFVDVRDETGLVQCVIEEGHKDFVALGELRIESAVSFEGTIALRDAETINESLPTGTIELRIQSIDILSPAETLPFQVTTDDNAPEDLRLHYRFLDLRRAWMRKNILLRSAVIASIRRRMEKLGFVEIQTPILTASSPEGARDYLVPSRLYRGCFYALPQAPQIFKQLLMVSSFERYFQIAPCFRDEDARSDRSPGEFYQLDFEMAFATQEDVMAVLEPVLHGVFCEFAPECEVSAPPFTRFTYENALALFGSDKPDLRNPLRLEDVTTLFAKSSFTLFASLVEKGAFVRAIKLKEAGRRPRAWFDRMNKWAQTQGQGGLGYIAWENNEAKGPIAANLDKERLAQLMAQIDIKEHDAVFFVAGQGQKIIEFAGLAREKLCDEMDLRQKDSYQFCWVVDYPMYEKDEETGKIIFSHNPFSMPQGGLDALRSCDPLSIKAWQYDIVCNGVELSSGAIRNHSPDIMKEAFKIAGYDEKELEMRFGALLRAFRYGAPPHGGSAPGIDRIVMLLAKAQNLRDVIAFPMNGQAKDVLLGAPAEITPEQLKTLGLTVKPQKKT